MFGDEVRARRRQPGCSHNEAAATHVYRQGARLLAETGNAHYRALCPVSLGSMRLDTGRREQAQQAGGTAWHMLGEHASLDPT